MATVYKVITQYGHAEFVQLLRDVMNQGWVPMGNPTVNSETNTWMCILHKNSY